MRSPLRDVDYVLLTVESIQAHHGVDAFHALGAVFGMAGLERLAASFVWAAFPDEAEDFSLHVILSSVRNFARCAQAGVLPIPVPPEEYAGELGLLVTAYDLYHRPTAEIFRAIAALLRDAGRPRLAEVVLVEMPGAIAQAAGRML